MCQQALRKVGQDCALLKELQENMGAQIINTVCCDYGDGQKLTRYILIFPDKRYILSAFQIQQFDEEELMCRLLLFQLRRTGRGMFMSASWSCFAPQNFRVSAIQALKISSAVMLLNVPLKKLTNNH